MVYSSRAADVNVDELRALLLACGLPEASDRAALSRALASASAVAAAFTLKRTGEGGEAPRVAWSLFPAPPSRGQLVGFALASGDSSLVGSLSLVAVAEDWRGQGIGRTLVGGLLSALRNRYGVGDIGLLAPPHFQGFAEKCCFGPDSSGAKYMALSEERRGELLAGGDGGPGREWIDQEGLKRVLLEGNMAVARR